jgi:hypothetical protein
MCSSPAIRPSLPGAAPHREAAGNRSALPIEWRIVKDYLQRMVTAIRSAAPGSFQAVDCGMFSRKRISGE